ncbi:WD40 repeat-like protein [Colletotrichum somersetense]|nr:WD40 repeat-like protein [Colletotrichum somersetense]
MMAAGSATGRPCPGVLSEFNGTGISHPGPGDFSVGRDLIIGVQDRSEQDTKFLADLRSTDPRDDKRRIERTKGGLLRDSYRWILDHDDFRRWRDDDQSRLLWIKGDPGKGKTMLLCGIIDELEKLPAGTRTLSYFFCQATDARLNNATAVLRGLIYQLLDQEPSLIGRVRKKYDHAGKKLFEDANSWDALSKMLISILEEPSMQNAYIVIDALDECEADLSQLLHLIIQLSSTSRTKLIVSSRNKPGIQDKIRATETQTRLLLELKENAQHVSQAVNTYITQCVSMLAQLEGDTLLQDQVQQKMQRKADGTFLWVALVVQELRETQSWDILEVIENIPAGLDELYGRMMGQIQRLRRKDPELCRSLLSTVTVAYRPLHLDELRALADLPPNISSMRQHVVAVTAMCGSFLTIRDDVVYLVHQSAKDFLTKDGFLFPSGLVVGHNTIASRSIQVMSKTLQRDIYSLRAPGFPTNQVKPPDPDPLASARYSCVYWVNHFAEGMPSAQEQCREFLQDNRQTCVFLEQHFLHWLEALSLLKSISAGILQVSKLAHIVQAYASALIFSPKRSIIRELFRHEEPAWMMVKPDMEDEWDACLQTLEGHRGIVISVAFSGDGTQLASASHDYTVKVWDAATGQCLRTLGGHSDFVNSVAFSGDGTQLASASDDKTVKIWDAATDHCLRTLAGHSDAVISCLRTLGGHSDFVNSVAFSGDGTQLASASDDKTVKVWDAATGQCLRTLGGHSDFVNSVAFSGDGTQLASASADTTTKVWDAATGQCLQTLNGHTSFVYSAAFSGDGTQLASASYDKTFKVWDATTGQCLRTLAGHSSSVTSVAFSGDGTQLVSASWDKTVKVWDAATSQCLRTLEGHSDAVISMAFSGDGTQLASASDDNTVKVWDAATGQCLRTLEGHNSSVRSTAFSGDSTQLASASDDDTVKVWDAATGQCLRTLEGHSSYVYSVAFSGDGAQLASASWDTTVKVWDAATGLCLRTLEGHSHNVTSVAFSGDGTQLVSASEDETVKIWDAATGQCLRTLDVGRTLSYISFSTTGSQLDTEIGEIDLETPLTESTTTEISLTNATEKSHFGGYAISTDNVWITRDSTNLVWLPPEYRSRTSAVAGSTVAIGCASGRVMAFRFIADELVV